MGKTESNSGANPRNRQNGDSSGRWFVLAIIGIFVIGGLGIAAAVTLAGDDDIDDVDPTAPVQIVGEALPRMGTDLRITTAETDDAAGSVAPKLVGTDFAGEEVSISADGRAKAVYFIAHWCQHCQQEVPMVASLVERGLVPEGLDLYSVSTHVDVSRGNYPPQRWLEEEEWTVPVIRDTEDKDALVSYGAGGYPYVVYLDGDNKVLFRTKGSISEAETLELWNQVGASAS